VFSVNAQIYMLDAVSSNWTPATTGVVEVSFYYDPATNRTRIIGMEEDEAKVNSMILPGMSFMKPSETFGQWLDLTTNQLFGLNFTSVADTDNFALMFKTAVEGKRPTGLMEQMKTIIPLAQQTMVPAVAAAMPAMGGSGIAKASALNKTTPTNFMTTSSTSTNVVAVDNGMSKQVAELTAKLTQKEAELQMRTNEVETLSITAASFDALQIQSRSMQSENDSLKSQVRMLTEQLSKAQTNAGAEQQLKASKDDVARLKAALLQNSTNANLWKDQLTKVEEENKILQDKVKKLEEIQKTFASVLGK